MKSDISHIVDGFPHPVLTKITTRPTYASLKVIQLQLNANAISVKSELGNGRLGLVRLAVTEAEYNKKSDVPFATPTNPGVLEETAGLTQHQIAAAAVAHKEKLRKYQEYNATDKALRQQLMAAVPDMYYEALNDEDFAGYGAVTTLDLLTHLYDNYGKITAAELASNDSKMRESYDPAMPIEKLFQRINTSAMLAKRAKAGYTEQHIVSTAYNIIFNTGLFNEACREWRRVHTDDQTWAEFKLHFATAHQEMRESQTTTQSAGYHGANNTYCGATQTTYRDEPPMEAYANLVASDRSTVSQLTSTNSTLTAALTEAMKAIATAQADMAAMKQQMTQLSNQQRNRQQQGQGNSHKSKSSNKRSNNAVSNDRRWYNSNYCWSHGYHVADVHTSATCKYPKPDHKHEATRANNMGGSQANKDLVA
jgi:hypothetical protein